MMPKGLSRLLQREQNNNSWWSYNTKSMALNWRSSYWCWKRGGGFNKGWS